MEVAELAARVEQSQPTPVLPPAKEELSLFRQGESQLSIARMHLSIERELFRLSWLTLEDRTSVSGWSISRHVDELLRADELDADLAENIRDFVQISSKILRGAEVEEATKLRATVAGSVLAAQLHFRSQVRRLERDFEGHGLWHMHRRGDRADNEYYMWSAVAASMPEFDFSFEVYAEAAERFNSGPVVKEHPKDALYVLSLDEFVAVLEFRETELLRLLDTWHTHEKGDIWKQFESANYWQWPEEWGDLGWKGPIIRHGLSVYAAEEDLLQTRNALQRYRPKLAAEKSAVRRAG